MVPRIGSTSESTTTTTDLHYTFRYHAFGPFMWNIFFAEIPNFGKNGKLYQDTEALYQEFLCGNLHKENIKQVNFHIFGGEKIRKIWRIKKIARKKCGNYGGRGGKLSDKQNGLSMFVSED